MPVIPASDAPVHVLPHAHFTSLVTPRRGARETSVWRVTLNAGAPATRHSLTREEIFVVLRGSARVAWEGESQLAAAGDAILVPAGVSFALCAEGRDGAELLCCLPVGGQAQLPDGRLFTPPWAE
jgi:quercetin dioxygenase-like cupin family protein